MPWDGLGFSLRQKKKILFQVSSTKWYTLVDAIEDTGKE